MKRLTLALSLVAITAFPEAADHRLPPEISYRNRPYDGGFTFVRLRFNPSYWGPGDFMWGLDLKWNHDYPRAGVHLEKMLQNLTTVDANQGVENVLTLDDPALFDYPWAYLCEVGFWTLADSEIKGLRDYLLKGGFLVIDDFVMGQWENFDVQIHRVLPNASSSRSIPPIRFSTSSSRSTPASTCILITRCSDPVTTGSTRTTIPESGSWF